MRTQSSLWLLAILFFFALGKAQAQLIFTKAGGNDAYGNYGPAVSASLSNPTGVTFDKSGNLYIADQNNFRIRKVSVATGIINTVAGDISQGPTGDGGPGLTATLRRPVGIAFDTTGSLYIADNGNNRIRKVDATTGIITTVAGFGLGSYSGDGMPATSSNLNAPTNIAFDNKGNLYIADEANSRIRKVDALSKIITTVAGLGFPGFSGDGGLATSAHLNFPTGIAVDNDGNLFIADKNNHRIRKVDAQSGIITTVAGSNSFGGYSGDGGLGTAATLRSPYNVTLDGSSNIIIADAGNNCIRKIDATTGIITTIAGGSFGFFSGDGGPATIATLLNPSGATFDGSGNMYIADAGNNRVRKVDAVTGIISTVGGNGTTSFLGDGSQASVATLFFPMDMVLDGSGNLYIADNGNNRVRKVDAVTGVVTTVAGSGRQGFSGDGGNATNAYLNLPSDIVIDGNGNLYIADLQNDRIRKVDAATGNISTFAGTGMRGYAGDGGQASAAGLFNPDGLALDGNGNLYVADLYNNRIRKINTATGIITTVAGNGSNGYSGDGGPATGAAFRGPKDVVVDGSGNLFICDAGNNCIRKVNAATGIITTVAGDGTPGYSGDGGSATSATLRFPTGLALDGSGNLYIADHDNNVVRRVEAATGIITTIAGNSTKGFTGDGGIATNASLYLPSDLILDGSGNLYISDSYNGRIRYLCATSSLAASTKSGVRPVFPEQSSPAVFVDNCAVQLKLQSSGANPVAGNVIDSVWIEPSVPVTAGGQPYVQRHYGITPSQNGATSTATVTLYYTQADFTAYNAVPDHGADLPLDATDAANNKANIRIYKRSGTSGNGTGLFDTYSGTTTGIVPTSVVWDSNLNAWAVSFDVVGFSGFFLASASIAPLPLTLQNFSARLQMTDGVLNWRTVNEQGVASFDVERSIDGRSYAKVGNVSATNESIGSTYSFTDKNITLLGFPVVYYRLKMVDIDGAFRYSHIVPLNISQKAAIVRLYPNPVHGATSLQVVSTRKGMLRYTIIDAMGRTLAGKNINVVEGNNVFTIETIRLSAGTYTLLVQETEATKELKFVKL